MEKLADLPPAALITFGAVLAVIFAARHLGLLQGQKAAPAADKAQVAAVIVDPTALNKATAAGEAVAEALRAFGKLGDDHTHMLCRRMEAMTDAIEAHTAILNAMILEMARGSSK